MINRSVLSALALAGLAQPACAYDIKTRLDLEPLIMKHATANNVPPALIHRIIIRESRYNARAVGRGGTFGLMQIKHGTARALGYRGSAEGLLDADTNLTYGVRYLSGAYRVAGGDQNQAVGYYARGYYYDAKRRGMLDALARTGSGAEAVTAAPQSQQAIVSVVAPHAGAPLQTLAAAPEPSGRRSARSAKRRAPTVPVLVSAQPDGSAVVVQTQTGASASQQAKPTAGGEQVGAPLRRSARSARRPPASGADHSAQTVSAQPGGPGRHP